MALGGWCDACGSYVMVTGAWMCPQGHAYTDVRNHYYIDTGQPVCAPWLGYRTTPVSAEGYGETPGSKEAVLRAIAEGVVQQPGFAAMMTSEVDLLIHMEDVYSAYTGFYEAKIRADEAQKRLTAEDSVWYDLIPNFKFENPKAGEHWGWPRDMSVHFRLNLFGTHQHVDDNPLWWEYGNTQVIVDRIAGEQGWFVEWTKHMRRPDPDEWNG